MFRSLCKAKKYPTIMTGEEEAEEEWKNVRKLLSEETEVKVGGDIRTWEEELKKNGQMEKKIQSTRKEKKKREEETGGIEEEEENGRRERGGRVEKSEE